MSSFDCLPEHVQSALKCIVKDSGLQNYTIQVKSGSEIGDGFAGELTSVVMKGVRDVDHGNNTKIELNLLCKLPPSNENRRREFFSDFVFGREICFYTNVLPTFIDFQREKLIPEQDRFRAYPKCYAGLNNRAEGEQVIIMEDLRRKGFQMWNKSKPTTLDNIRLVLEQIGKFHAISFAMEDQRPIKFAEYKKFSDFLFKFITTSNLRGIFDGSFERAKNSLHHNHHKEIFSKLQVNLADYVSSCLDQSVCVDFAVVSHGDLWNNNIMYRFNENNVVEDVKFVDWQMIRYVSPATDLIYHIFTATDKPLRDAEYMNLLQHYHSSLSRMIKMLGSDPDKLFTFNNLLNEMKRVGNLGLLMAPLILSISFADSSHITNIDKICDQEANGERCHQELITGFSDEAQIEYDNRLNDIIGDLVNLRYYKELN